MRVANDLTTGGMLNIRDWLRLSTVGLQAAQIRCYLHTFGPKVGSIYLGTLRLLLLTRDYHGP